MKFYYPLKSTRISIDSDLFKRCDLDPNFILQIKKNGWRIQIHKEGNDVKFWTRHKIKMEELVLDADWKMLKTIVQNIKVESCILDGEFLHRRGKLKNTIYLWDIFELDGIPVNKPYGERKALLDSIVLPYNNFFTAKDYVTNFKQIWDNLEDPEENEGIVLKDTRERLYIDYNKTIKSSKQFKILLETKSDTKYYKTQKVV